MQRRRLADTPSVKVGHRHERRRTVRRVVARVMPAERAEPDNADPDRTLAVVAPGIAEALLATAFGLVAAIPAVVAYNKFSGDVDRYATRVGTFTDEFAVVLSRELEDPQGYDSSRAA
jgi:hypothetical protein